MNGVAMYASEQMTDHNAIVEKHASLVKRIACHLINRLPASVQALHSKYRESLWNFRCFCQDEVRRPESEVRGPKTGDGRSNRQLAVDKRQISNIE